VAKTIQITIIGAGDCGEEARKRAFEVGERLGRAGATLLCGGRGGVMDAAAAGAEAVGGLVVGVLPGSSPADTRPGTHLGVELYTGIGQARNQVLVLSGDAVIGVSGGWGTLTEIAIALKHEVPVVLLDSWKLERPDGEVEPLLQRANDPAEAVGIALAAARERTTATGGTRIRLTRRTTDE